MRLLYPFIATVMVLAAGCTTGESDTPIGPVGQITLPLSATSVTGVEYRLSPARFRIIGTGYNHDSDGSDLDLLRVGLAPGDYTIRLMGDWQLNVVEEGGLVPVEAVLQSPNPQSFQIVEGEYSDVLFRFGVGDDAIAFGKGQARVGIEVNDASCVPAEEVCNGVDDDCDGEVDEGLECVEICDSGIDEDGDGYIDCDDYDCSEYPACNVPAVGTTGDTGVAEGSDWQVCRADVESAWISSGDGGGTYDTTAVCQALGYDAADAYGGTCGTICGNCGTENELYDSMGWGFPDAYNNTVNWRCVHGFVPPHVGRTGDVGVAEGANWEVCRADENTAWISAGDGGGTYDVNAVCQSLGYLGVSAHGGNCNDVCGYCGTPGEETYDNMGLGFPDAYQLSVNWRCAMIIPRQ